MTKQFFGNWSYEIDRKTFRNMLVRYYEGMPMKFHTEVMENAMKRYGGDVEKLSQDLFANSIFTKQQDLLNFLMSDKENGVKVITEDPLYQLSINYYRVFVERISRQRGAWQMKMLPLYKVFQEGMLEMKQDQVLYPDANGSLRVSFGTVRGCEPEDGLS
ncbi:MAG: S46 family peptidase, partial [Butyricimonas faecihominis]